MNIAVLLSMQKAFRSHGIFYLPRTDQTHPNTENPIQSSAPVTVGRQLLACVAVEGGTREEGMRTLGSIVVDISKFYGTVQ